MELNANFWNSKYLENDIGWDIGEVSTPLKTYIDQLKNKDLRILIPGSGNAYEAEYLHHLGFKNVYVVDLSKHAINNIKTRVPDFPKAHLIQADFFELHHSHPNLSFDLILEQTFFCAINPAFRLDYVKQIHRLLNENGKLIGLLFNVDLNTDKPPFGGYKNDYISYFKPYFKIEVMDECHNSISSRMGRELFINLHKL